MKKILFVAIPALLLCFSNCKSDNKSDENTDAETQQQAHEETIDELLDQYESIANDMAQVRQQAKSNEKADLRKLTDVSTKITTITKKLLRQNKEMTPSQAARMRELTEIIRTSGKTDSDTPAAGASRASDMASQDKADESLGKK